MKVHSTTIYLKILFQLRIDSGSSDLDHFSACHKGLRTCQVKYLYDPHLQYFLLPVIIVHSINVTDCSEVNDIT